jgi:type IV pilus assembly protein PilY1
VAGSPVPPPSVGYMVVAGTGKFYEVADITNNAQQTLYGIWDPVAFGAATIPAGTSLTNRTTLVQQTIGAATVGPNGNTYYPISTNAVDYAVGKRGWYIDFPYTGQRLVYPLDFLSGRFAAADTISPSNVSLDPCSNLSGGTGYFYILDALSGAGPTEAVLDTNGDGNVDGSDLVVSGLEGKADGRNVTLEVSKNATRTTYVNVSGGAPGGTLITISCRLTGTCLTTTPTRIKSREWRQLFMR